MSLTLGDLRELIEEFSDLPDDVEIRFAQQPSWPFEYSISSNALLHQSEIEEGDCEEDIKQVIYFAEGQQLGYLPSEIAEQLGWR